MYLNKRILLTDNELPVVDLTNKHGYYIAKKTAILVENVSTFIVPTYEIAAYPTWLPRRNKILEAICRARGKKLAIETIFNEENKHLRLLTTDDDKDPEEIITFEKISITGIEANDATTARRGMIWYEEIAMIAIYSGRI